MDKYGADVRKTRAELARGTNLICTVTPDPDTIQRMEQCYAVSAVKVWVDTPASVAAERVSNDTLRSARHENDTAKTVFSHVFKPTGELSRDKSAFAALIRQLLA